MNKLKGVRQKMIRSISYGVYLFFIVAICLEVALHIYNPFHLRLRGDKILLPVNQRILISNTLNPHLDKEIVNTRNGLGLRGPEKPADFENRLSIVAVGGSTTECHFLNDDKTWPYLTGKLLGSKFDGIWMNNAGFDGHSTFGHQVLLNDYLIKLQPKLILFLTGINDVENEQPTFHDKLNASDAYPDLKHFLYNNCEILNIAVNLARGWRAQRFNNTTQELRTPEKNNELFIPDSVFNAKLRSQQTFLIHYRKRIEQLIDTCISHHIQPVFITQPCLSGRATDSVTNVDLSTLKIDDHMNGLLYWEILELYNEQVRKRCTDKNIPLIDLASLMPKNSLYYYDQTHYTNEGAQQVAAIIAAKLSNILNEKFPGYRLGHLPLASRL